MLPRHHLSEGLFSFGVCDKVNQLGDKVGGPVIAVKLLVELDDIIRYNRQFFHQSSHHFIDFFFRKAAFDRNRHSRHQGRIHGVNVKAQMEVVQAGEILYRLGETRSQSLFADLRIGIESGSQDPS